MFRLRTTLGVSALALAVGIAGTAWLSSLTGDWVGPSGGHALGHVDKVRAVLRRHPRPTRVQPIAAHSTPSDEPAQTPPPASAGLPTLTPVDMPPLAASVWKREPLASGRVLLRLDVDGAGQVTHAEVAQGSGNAALDQRALRTVARWRFAVPAGRADGLTGELLMRFEADPSP